MSRGERSGEGVHATLLSHTDEMHEVDSSVSPKIQAEFLVLRCENLAKTEKPCENRGICVHA